VVVWVSGGACLGTRGEESLVDFEKGLFVIDEEVKYKLLVLACEIRELNLLFGKLSQLEKALLKLNGLSI
jgi:hypothetical protein